ncbi:MAG TPA: VWA domain-containing protein [Vicinamibacterales bacterium]|nr:VWA domain-containing protein [Vicinamibacterales bacterium]
MTLRLFPVLALAAATIAAQQPFKSGAQTVVVYATVTDSSGHIVTDLARDRFEVYDGGKPQAITTFANDVQPITVVMMLDRSVSMLHNFSLVEEAAGTFVDRLGSSDKARIGSFSNRIEVDPRDFSSDKEELRHILKTELQDPGPTPLWNAMGVGMTALLHQTGRRVILVFTDGMDRPMNGRSNNLSLKDVSRRADEEDVMVYGIGLVGDPFAGYGGQFSRGGLGPRPQGQPDRPDPGLEKLAAASGGGYFELTRTADLEGTFARVADELHHQYLLGFTPAKVDGKSHPLDVRVKGEGLTVRARKSYLSARQS